MCSILGLFDTILLILSFLILNLETSFDGGALFSSLLLKLAVFAVVFGLFAVIPVTLLEVIRLPPFECLCLSACFLLKKGFGSIGSVTALYLAVCGDTSLLLVKPTLFFSRTFSCFVTFSSYFLRILLALFLMLLASEADYLFTEFLGAGGNP